MNVTGSTWVCQDCAFVCLGRGRGAAITLAGIELAHRIRKRQFSLGRGRYRNFGSLKQMWDRALAWFLAGE